MEKIYVAIFNFYGSYEQLLEKYKHKYNVTLVNGNTLFFSDLNGKEISKLMESAGADYNYSYVSAHEAWTEL